jgi:YtxH-like protein
MRGRRNYTLFDVLLGTGLDLLDLVRHRAADHAESISEKAKDAYDEASGRVGRASRAITGEDRSGISSTAALLLGVGVGVALGILFAPASGEQVRRNIADSARDFGERIRSRVGGEPGESGPADRL